MAGLFPDRPRGGFGGSTDFISRSAAAQWQEFDPDRPPGVPPVGFPIAEEKENRAAREMHALTGFFAGIPRGLLELGKLIAPGEKEGEMGWGTFGSVLGRSFAQTGKHIVNPFSFFQDVQQGTLTEVLINDLGNLATVFSLGAGAAGKIGNITKSASLAAKEAGNLTRAGQLAERAAKIGSVEQKLRIGAAPYRTIGRKAIKEPTLKAAAEYGRILENQGQVRFILDKEGNAVGKVPGVKVVPSASRFLRTKAWVGNNIVKPMDLRSFAIERTRDVATEAMSAYSHPMMQMLNQVGKRLKELDPRLSDRAVDRLIGEEMRYRLEGHAKLMPALQSKLKEHGLSDRQVDALMNWEPQTRTLGFLQNEEVARMFDVAEQQFPDFYRQHPGLQRAVSNEPDWELLAQTEEGRKLIDARSQAAERVRRAELYRERAEVLREARDDLDARIAGREETLTNPAELFPRPKGREKGSRTKNRPRGGRPPKGPRQAGRAERPPKLPSTRVTDEFGNPVTHQGDPLGMIDEVRRRVHPDELAKIADAEKLMDLWDEVDTMYEFSMRQAQDDLFEAARLEDQVAIANMPRELQPLAEDFSKARQGLRTWYYDGKGKGDWAHEEFLSVLEGITPSWSEFLDSLTQAGLNPSQIPRITDMAHYLQQNFQGGRTRLGQMFTEEAGELLPRATPGRMTESPSMKPYTGAIRDEPIPDSMFGGVVTTPGTFVAQAVEGVWQDSNEMLVKYLHDNNIITKIPRHRASDMRGWVTLETLEDGTHLMVPRNVQRALNKFRTTDDRLSMVLAGSAQAIDLFRVGVLHFSPKWLFNNTFGNMVLATLARPTTVMNPRNWVEAYHDARQKKLLDGFEIEIAHDKVAPKAVESASIKGELGYGPNGERRLAEGIVSNVPGIRWVVDKTANMNSKTDAFFRAMVYKGEIRKGVKQALKPQLVKTADGKWDVVRGGVVKGRTQAGMEAKRASLLEERDKLVDEIDRLEKNLPPNGFPSRHVVGSKTDFEEGFDPAEPFISSSSTPQSFKLQGQVNKLNEQINDLNQKLGGPPGSPSSRREALEQRSDEVSSRIDELSEEADYLQRLGTPEGDAHAHRIDAEISRLETEFELIHQNLNEALADHPFVDPETGYLDADVIFAKTQRGEVLEPEELEIVEQATQTAIKAMVDYGNMSPFERVVIRRVIPFYAWQKNIAKLAMSLPLDHPSRFATLALISRNLGGYSKEERETLPEWLLPSLELPNGARLGIGGLNPLQDSLELFRPDASGLQDSLNPILEEATRFIFRNPENPFGVQEVGPGGFTQALVDPKDRTKEFFGNLPPLRAFRDAEAAAGFFGPSIYGPERVQEARDRLLKERREAILSQHRAETPPLPPLNALVPPWQQESSPLDLFLKKRKPMRQTSSQQFSSPLFPSLGR